MHIYSGYQFAIIASFDFTMSPNDLSIPSTKINTNRMHCGPNELAADDSSFILYV